MKLWYSLVIAIVLTIGGFSAAIADPININTATAKEMETGLKGIGPRRAAAIEQYRNEYGPFQSVDEILKVPGVGNKILEENRHNLTVSMVTNRRAEATTKAIK